MILDRPALACDWCEVVFVIEEPEQRGWVPLDVQLAAQAAGWEVNDDEHSEDLCPACVRDAEAVGEPA